MIYFSLVHKHHLQNMSMKNRLTTLKIKAGGYVSKTATPLNILNYYNFLTLNLWGIHHSTIIHYYALYSLYIIRLPLSPYQYTFSDYALVNVYLVKQVCRYPLKNITLLKYNISNNLHKIRIISYSRN